MKVRRFSDEEAVRAAVETLLRERFARPGWLMLSGGKTPLAVYRRLAERPCPVHPERRLFLSDERMVPFDSPENNAHNLQPMLEALGCADRFLRVETSLSPAEAARRFAEALAAVREADLGLLGMGADGHTAGLFSIEDARRREGPDAIAVDRPDGKAGVSVTPAFLKRVRRILLLVTGERKREAVEKLLHAPDTIPAGVALREHPAAELWTDLDVE